MTERTSYKKHSQRVARIANKWINEKPIECARTRLDEHISKANYYLSRDEAFSVGNYEYNNNINSEITAEAFDTANVGLAQRPQYRKSMAWAMLEDPNTPAEYFDKIIESREKYSDMMYDVILTLSPAMSADIEGQLEHQDIAFDEQRQQDTEMWDDIQQDDLERDEYAQIDVPPPNEDPPPLPEENAEPRIPYFDQPGRIEEFKQTLVDKIRSEKRYWQNCRKYQVYALAVGIYRMHVKRIINNIGARKYSRVMADQNHIREHWIRGRQVCERHRSEGNYVTCPLMHCKSRSIEDFICISDLNGYQNSFVIYCQNAQARQLAQYMITSTAPPFIKYLLRGFSITEDGVRVYFENWQAATFMKEQFMAWEYREPTLWYNISVLRHKTRRKIRNIRKYIAPENEDQNFGAPSMLYWQKAGTIRTMVPKQYHSYDGTEPPPDRQPPEAYLVKFGFRQQEDVVMNVE